MSPFLAARLALGLVLVALASGCRPSGETVERGGAFGTAWSLTLPASGDAPLARKIVEGELARLDQVFSTYRHDSELAVWNGGGGEAILSGDLLKVADIGLRMHAATGGVFDLARGTGSFAIEGGALVKRVPGVELDCSAIAKGYAIDRIVELLESAGFATFLFEFGGELVGVGTSWNIGLEAPAGGVPVVYEVLALEDVAVATSGQYRDPGHLVDPVGGGVADLASVSVLHASAAEADAWATALFLLGSRRGIELANKQGLEAYFVINRGPEAAEIRHVDPDPDQ